MSRRSKKKTPEISLLHIYDQHAWHDDVYIVSNKQGLEILLAAVKQAIKEGRGEADDLAFTADGEGYNVIVLRRDDPWLEGWSRVALPYTGDCAKNKRSNILWPEELDNNGVFRKRPTRKYRTGT